MARISLSPLFNAIAGSVGNATFQNHSSGTSLRTKPSPRKFRTVCQSGIGSNILYLQRLWQSMVDSQKAAYANYNSLSRVTCKHNKNVLLKGFQIFLRHNLLLMSVGHEPCQYLYSQNVPEITISYSVYIDDVELSLTLVDAFQDEVFVPIIKLSRPLSSPNCFDKSLLRIVNPFYPGPIIFSMLDNYVLKFGYNVRPGESVYCSIMYVAKSFPLIIKPVYVMYTRPVI